MDRAEILAICIVGGVFIAAFILLRLHNPCAVLTGFGLLVVMFVASWVVRLAPWHSGGRRRTAEFFIAIGVIVLWRAFGGKIR
jgi:hypothetical protein